MSQDEGVPAEKTGVGDLTIDGFGKPMEICPWFAPKAAKEKASAVVDPIMCLVREERVKNAHKKKLFGNKTKISYPHPNKTKSCRGLVSALAPLWLAPLDLLTSVASAIGICHEF